LYSSPTVIRIVKPRRRGWAGHVTHMGEKRNAFRIMVEKPEERRPLGKHRLCWVGNVKILYFREIEWGVMDWIDLAQDRDNLRALCTYNNELSGSVKCWKFLE
jgi:hypothetical protein